MNPITYRGYATIKGERLDAELRVDDELIRLMQGRGFEIISWPVASVGVAKTANGAYVLDAGGDSFEFSPRVDSGLGDEIAQRAGSVATGAVVSPSRHPRTARRAGNVARLQPPVDGPDEDRSSNGGHHLGIDHHRSNDRRRVESSTLADRVEAKGTRQRRHRPSLSGDEIDTSRVYLGVGLSVVAIAMVTLVATAFGTEPEETPSTLGFVGEATTESVPPTTVVSVVSTTTPPTTVAAGDSASQVPALELNLEELTRRWNTLAFDLSVPLEVGGLEVNGNEFTFDAGHLVEMGGTIGEDGSVDLLRFAGDPNGTIDEDRLVLTAVGMTISASAPDLTPSGRRAMLDALGLDIDSPQLAGLDGSITYEGYVYRLRWDGELGRIVFVVTDEG